MGQNKLKLKIIVQHYIIKENMIIKTKSSS
jgi:hypothetical protein